MRNLSAANFLPIRMLAVRGAGCSPQIHERDLHRRLRKYQVRGEWFMPAPPVLAAVEEARRVSCQFYAGLDPITDFDAETYMSQLEEMTQ